MALSDSDAAIARPFIESVMPHVRSLGLEVGEPRVLNVGVNVVLHLEPAPVVARIATITAEMRGNAADYLRRELSITSALADAGNRVIAPTRLVEPGPHTTPEGVVFSLLDYRDMAAVDLDSPAHARAAGEAYAELAVALGGLPDAVGLGDEGHPWAEIAALISNGATTLDRSAMSTIIGVVEHLRSTEPDDPWQLVHGDAHKNNVAFVDGEALWFDFEDANLRPLAWDLATLRRAWPAAGDAACAALDVDPDSVTMRWHHELRDVYALLWNVLYAQRFQQAAAPAAQRLAAYLQAQRTR